jgi:hypothetical protein
MPRNFQDIKRAAKMVIMLTGIVSLTSYSKSSVKFQPIQESGGSSYHGNGIGSEPQRGTGYSRGEEND